MPFTLQRTQCFMLEWNIYSYLFNRTLMVDRLLSLEKINGNQNLEYVWTKSITIKKLKLRSALVGLSVKDKVVSFCKCVIIRRHGVRHFDEIRHRLNKIGVCTIIGTISSIWVFRCLKLFVVISHTHVAQVIRWCVCVCNDPCNSSCSHHNEIATILWT